MLFRPIPRLPRLLAAERSAASADCAEHHEIRSCGLSRAVLSHVVNQIRQLPDRGLILRPGRTVGVMTVRCERRGLGYIKAYSGAVHGERPALWSSEPTISGHSSAARQLIPGAGPVTGWVPSVANWGMDSEIGREKLAVEAQIHELTKQISHPDCSPQRRQLLRAQRKELSRELMAKLHSSYVVQNGRGIRRSVLEITAPAIPPGGTAECSVPKLLQYAAVHELQPVAACEGLPEECDATGGLDRNISISTPVADLDTAPIGVVDACTARCLPILGFMLCGHKEAAEVQRKKTAKPKAKCAVCGACVRIEKFKRHVANCCPRVFVTAKALVGSDSGVEALARAVAAARKVELEVVVEVLQAGGHRREIEAALSVTEEDARAMMRQASLACPLAQEDIALDVLFEDEQLLVVNKPSNLRVAPIHRWQGNTLLGRAVAHLGRPPHVVHRLDMDTTGVTVFAKTKLAAQSLGQQFRSRECTKEYIALCRKQSNLHLPVGRFGIDEPLLANKGVLQSVHQDGLAAKTLVEVLAQSEHANETSCLVKASPKTGRMHQIRVHLSHAGLGIWGDDLYGHLNNNVIQRQALHATGLHIVHPVTAQEISIVAQVPSDFKEATRRVGIEVGAWPDIFGSE